MPKTTVDGRESHALLARLAGRQHGTVAAWQLLTAGFTRRMIDRRVQAAQLFVIFAGVYAVGHRALSPLGCDMAAVLAGGPGAVLSHRSAANLQRFRKHGGLPEITVPRTGARQRTGIRIHVSATLTSQNTMRLNGIPVTTPARTLVDLADVLGADDLARAVSAAERADLIDRRRLWTPPGRRNPVRAPHVWTRSRFEREFRKALLDWGLPEPEFNQEILAGVEVDVVWRERRVVVELDHPHTHLNPESFESDPLKAERIADAGYTLRRVTERRFATRPQEVHWMLARLVT
jgi:very-short-patch-repair endonuclease